MPRTRPPYPEEFRREAIRLAQLGDKPQRKIAKDLGISDVTLRHWLKEDKAARGERPGVATASSPRSRRRRRSPRESEAAHGAAADTVAPAESARRGWRQSSGGS